MTEESDQRSWWRRTFGRSILSALIGHFFSDKNNAASVIAILLVATLCYIVAFKDKYEYAPGLLNIVFVVIGYYFGSKRELDAGDDDETGK
jgi:uncharacterized membrane protein